MDRNELIEKAKKFWAEQANQPARRSSTRAEAMADFVLSLETKDEWPQVNDEYWYLDGEGVADCRWDDCSPDDDRRKRGIYRTEEEADRADRQRIARTAIHRWIVEKAERVDWENGEHKYSPFLNPKHGCWARTDYVHCVPGWFWVGTIEEYNRMMSENAAHFEVLKEGE